MHSQDPEEDIDPNTQYHSPPPFCCPSFNTYSNDTRIADIATRVTRSSSQYDVVMDDFEFNLGSGSIDQGIRPVYPLFDPGYSGPDNQAVLQLRDLFFQEDDAPTEPPRYSSASSSDDDDDTNGVRACLWASKSPPPPPTLSPSRCTKSNSTGSVPARTGSKSWNLKNLLRRSKSSDAKQGLLLFNNKKKEKEKPPSTMMSHNHNTNKNGRRHSMDCNHSSNKNSSNNYYNNNKGVLSPGRFEWENKRKSYLPYKQDLLGLFGGPQTLRKINIPPF